MKRMITYYEDLKERLQDHDFAVGYLQEAFKDNDKGIFLVALRDVVEAWGGISKFAKLSRLHRTSLYRMLSRTGNPEIGSMVDLLQALGLKLDLIKDKRRSLGRAA